jgi:hypothetical protein
MKTSTAFILKQEGGRKLRDKQVIVNVYTRQNSAIYTIFKEYESNLAGFEFSFFSLSDPPAPKKILGSMIIIDESSEKDSFKLSERILSSYVYKPSFVVTSEKPDVESAVRWMKHGAADYIDAKNQYTVGQIDKIMKDALLFDGLELFGEVSEDIDPFTHPPVHLHRQAGWRDLKNDVSYEMTTLMVSILVNKQQAGIYSKDQLVKILSGFEKRFETIVTNMGGARLFWNYDNGVFVFHFEDKINAAIVSAISILNRMKIMCLESMNLQEVFDVKCTLHDGAVLYNSVDTKFITSDTINSVVHLQRHTEHANSIDITENVYNFLNPRIKRHFYFDGSYEGRDVYTYYYDFFHGE